jgi:hypothetical protein
MSTNGLVVSKGTKPFGLEIVDPQYSGSHKKVGDKS